MKNYYEILEVNEKASEDTIKKVFKMHVKTYHPDTAPEDKKALYEEKIKELNEAYEVLSDEYKRKLYDEQLEQNNIDNENYSEREALLNEEIMYLKNQLQKKDQIIEHFLGDLDLSEFYEEQELPERDNSINNFDYNDSKNYNDDNSNNNIYNNEKGNYIPYNENPQNLYEKLQNFFSSNRPYKNIYEHYFHLLLVFLAKIAIIVVFFVIMFAIITNITGINMFEIFYNSFLTKH